jgi:hypothetical protein
MSNLRSAVIALGTLCATTAFAQTSPTANVPAFGVQQQQQIIRQQMYDRGQSNAQSITQEQARSQQSLSNMTQQNQQMLNAQAPAAPPSPATIRTR